MLFEPPYIEVAVALPVSCSFTYEVPEPLRPWAMVGKRVLVPFKNLQATGYILELLHSTNRRGIKKILDILDDTPMFPSSMIPFFRWIADYYRYPIGEVIKGALPGGLNITHVETISMTEKGRSALAGSSLKPLDRTVLEVVGVRGPLRLRALYKEFKNELSAKALGSLERAGWIMRERRLKPGRVRPKMDRYVRAVEGRFSAESLSQVRRHILKIVEEHGEISIQALKVQVPLAGQYVKKMADDGFLTVVERCVYRDPFGEPIAPDAGGPVLTTEQGSVVGRVLNAFGKGFQTYLLYGVTASGKTEVYMRAVAAALERGEEALILVPEIALISQMERLFRARFGECVALLHSGLSKGERFDQWMRILRKEAKVAIGARSAIFAPFEHLGLIVVDEEHDDSYKSASRGLRYHARDLAVVRARFHGAVALLGSATPSVASYYNMQTRKFRGLNLSKRIENRLLPEVTVVDLREPTGRSRAKPFITKELKDAITETLHRGEQTLLFLNRRGFANYPACVHCGTPVRCRNCDITMTLHQEANAFKCHYCGYTRARAIRCEACGSSKIKLIGLGTEKVEATIKEMFPEVRVARMDRDTTARKGALVKILKDLKEGAVDILIGTQMVAKGHDYPNITLVGIICADLSLNFPDFRAGERTFQLLAQVAGRAGRGQQPGRVILQTFNPDHFCILTARDQDYGAFYDHEIRFRETLKYPPFSRLIQIMMTGRDKEETAQYAQNLGEICRALQSENQTYRKDVKLLGPVAAPLARLHRRYRWQILLKGLKPGPLHSLTRTLMGRAQKTIRKGAVKVVVDVDPVDMM
ncbi:MAG: primosomal protein N' [Desulfobacterales bacterium]|nr:primosomal protein N' [Desulfobacterales bacterium]